MRRSLTLGILAFVLAAVLHAQAGLTGKWLGRTKNGFQIELDLVASKARVTGTLTRNGQTSAIADGKVSNRTVTFKATLGDQTEAFTGEVGDEELRIWLDRQGPESAAVLKRVTN